jgi:hypothetical protein
MALAITMSRQALLPVNRGILLLLLANGHGTDAAFVLPAQPRRVKIKEACLRTNIYSPSLDNIVGFALDETDSAASQRPLAGSERGGDGRHSVDSTGAYQITFKAN